MSADGFKPSWGRCSLMRQEKLFRLGRVVIDGDLIEFEPEPTREFEAARSDIVSVGVAYQYREATEDREHTRIKLTARIHGQKEETHEAHIGDNPALDDSRRGFLSVPLHVGAKGDLRGHYVIESEYTSGPWAHKDRKNAHAQERVEGEFVIRVT